MSYVKKMEYETEENNLKNDKSIAGKIIKTKDNHIFNNHSDKHEHMKNANFLVEEFMKDVRKVIFKSFSNF